ncbi:MAG: hypothetical protein Q9212_000398 [Teloschistes hypoglaucus]
MSKRVCPPQKDIRAVAMGNLPRRIMVRKAQPRIDHFLSSYKYPFNYPAQWLVQARNVTFREKVLVQEPLLLDALLSKGAESPNKIVRMSSTLHARMTIPATASAFLTLTVQEAIQNPCADTLRPIFKVLSAVGPDLLDASPSEVVERMRDQFKMILKNVGPEDLSATNLFCFAVVALLSSSLAKKLAEVQGIETSPVTARPTGPATRSDIQQWARNLFASKRALKTLDIAVIKCITAFSRSYSLRVTEIVEWLNLSNTIITAVDDEARRLWVANDRSKVRKLIEKICSYNDSPDVLCAALQVIASLTDGSQVPQELMPLCKVVFGMPTASTLSAEFGAKIALSLDERSIQELLLALLDTASHEFGDGKCGLSRINASLVIAASLTKAVEDSASLRTKILYLLSTNALAAPLQKYLDSSRNGRNAGIGDDHSGYCPHLVAERQITLQQRIRTLIFKTSIFAQPHEPSLNTFLALALADEYTSQHLAVTPCRRYSSTSQPRKACSVTFLESGSTPASRADSHKWRDSIGDVLARNAQHQLHTIVQTMGEVCRDLEHRCNEVEKPLRDEEAKSSRLQVALDHSKARVAVLESLNHEQCMITEGIERERFELVARVTELERVQEELSDMLGASRKEIEETTRQAAEAAQKRGDEASEIELIHTAAIAEKEEALEACHRGEEALRAHVQEVLSELAQLRRKESSASEEAQRLEAKVAEHEVALSEAHAASHEKQQQMNQQKHLLDDMQTRNNRLKLEVTKTSNACDTMKADLARHTATIESQATEINSLRCDYENQLSAQTTKISKANMELERHKDELEEARELNNQVTAFWSKARGRNTAAEESPTSPVISQTSDDVENIHRRSSKTDQPQRTSPEAKRSQIHRRLASSNSAKDAADNPEILTSVGQRKPTRQPLGEVTTLNSACAKPTTRATAIIQTPSKDMGKGNVDSEMAEASFFNSDFFSSTDERLVANMHGRPVEHGSDDTTVDF